ncbi:hypothetical protein HDV00_009151 [Rhizophlyctis rosea]|nr:hypothetical protein HDV00_009151 [Rhizophlyctis rosea]
MDLRAFLRNLPIQALDLRLSSLKTPAETVNPTVPQSDLSTLRQWTDFDKVILNRLKSFPQQRLSPISVADYANLVTETPDVVQHAMTFMLQPVSRAINTAGVAVGEFASIGGNGSVIANPDKIWIGDVTARNPKPTLVVEFKTPWALVNQDLVTAWNSLTAPKTNKTVYKAITQIYEYMSLNHLRYGVLSTFEGTWFLQRVEGAAGVTGGVLEMAGPFTIRPSAPFSIFEALGAFMTIVNEDRFYTSPHQSPAPTPRNYTPTEFPVNRAGAVVNATFQGYPVILKTVDTTKYSDLAEELEHEAQIYHLLGDLQGNYIPQFVAYVTIWDLLDIIILDPRGTPFDSTIAYPFDAAQAFREALSQVHQKGVRHGDLRGPNLLVDSNGEKVVLIDFGLAVEGGTVAEFEEERARLEAILVGDDD